MTHPVFCLAASQPMLVAEHAAAYAGLLSEELAARSAQLKKRPSLNLAGIACLLVASTLAGVALLLWTSSPVTEVRAPWLFALMPALPAALGLCAIGLANACDTSLPFASLLRQLTEDAALLRTAAAP